MIKEAMKLALEALGNSWTEPGNKQYEFEKEAIIALREALAEQPAQQELTNIERHERNVKKFLAEQPAPVAKPHEQEPVAWEQFYPEMGKPKLAYLPPTESTENACYTPPQRTWVSLTDEEVIRKFNAICNGKPFEISRVLELHKAIEAKLRSKNT